MNILNKKLPRFMGYKKFDEIEGFCKRNNASSTVDAMSASYSVTVMFITNFVLTLYV